MPSDLADHLTAALAGCYTLERAFDERAAIIAIEGRSRYSPWAYGVLYDDPRFRRLFLRLGLPDAH